MNYKNVVVALAHPDDETFGCGGTLAMLAKRGARVTYVCATKGEMGRNMGHPTFATRESLGKLREAELRAACDALGIADLRLLHIWDKMVEFVDPQELADRIGAILAELKPDLVITYWPGFGVHPDHNAMGVATIKAVEAISPAERPVVHCKAFGPGIEVLGEPEIVDITETLPEVENAVRAHRSQSEPMIAAREARFAKEPAAREQWLQQRNKERYWVYKFN